MNTYFTDVMQVYSALFASKLPVLLVMVGLILLLSGLWLIVFAAKSWILKSILLIGIQLIALFVSWRIGLIFVSFTSLLFLPSLLMGLLFYAVSPYSEKDLESKPVVKFETSKGNLYADLQTHAAVFGSTGAGKTDSVFVRIIKHIFKFSLSSVIFDYKEFELMEKVYYFQEEKRKENLKLEAQGKPIKKELPVYTVYLADPNYSHHIDIANREDLENMEDVEEISNVLFDNLYPEGSSDKTWQEGASAAFAGTLWRMKEDYPDHCSLPYVAAMVLTASPEQLITFVKGSIKSSVLAAPFLDALSNPKMLGSFKSSISSAIKKICTPNIFMVMSKSDFDIAVNKPGYESIVGLVNKPEYDSVYLPVYATIARAIMNRCSHRGRDYSIWILDEGSALKFKLLYRVLAVLRSFKVHIVWGLQDKVQGEILYNLKELKAILTNLGFWFIGKANDPETAEYYTKMFEQIDVEERSVSTGDGATRVTKSVREKRKYKSVEFRRLNKGEFFTLDRDGRDRKQQFKRENYTPKPPEKINHYSKEEIEHHYNSVFAKVKEILADIKPAEVQTQNTNDF
jgi:type IV secretory pathway TraG/TraD family ATPase VirD4